MNDKDMSFEDLLDESFAPKAQIEMGSKVEATVVSIGSEFVFLDLGVREEGLLERMEVEKDGELTVAPGDRMTVLVSGRREGAIRCALRVGAAGAKGQSSDKEETLATLKEAFDADVPVEGTVKESIKGGFNIALMGLRAFCPISQIDNQFCENPEEHVDRTYAFAIIKYEENGRNLVLSRRKLLEREAEERAEALWPTLEVGKTYAGTVSSLQKYGAFIDIGGIDGLLHVSEISHQRIADPSEVLEKGQQVKVAIKDLDPVKKKIGFSLKALEADPWDEAAATLTSGQVVSGKVMRCERFGAFVELFPGVEGLVHISEITKEKRINNPREIVDLGQQVQVRILEVDLGSRRISLSMITDTDEEDWRGELAQAPASQTSGFGTFGDILSRSQKKK